MRSMLTFMGDLIVLTNSKEEWKSTTQGGFVNASKQMNQQSGRPVVQMLFY